MDEAGGFRRFGGCSGARLRVFAMIQITVTAEDIAHGRQKDCNFCPVAKACQRALACEALTVTPNSVRWSVNGIGREVELPPFVSLKISVFDASGEMEPFGFELDI